MKTREIVIQSSYFNMIARISAICEDANGQAVLPAATKQERKSSNTVTLKKKEDKYE